MRTSALMCLPDAEHLHHKARNRQDTHNHDSHIEQHARDRRHCERSHDVPIRADNGHKHEQDGQNHAIDELRRQHDAHKVEPRHQDDPRRQANDEGDDALEGGRFFPSERDAGLPAKCLTDHK